MGVKPRRFVCPGCQATYSRSEVAARVRKAGRPHRLYWGQWSCPACDWLAEKLPPVAPPLPRIEPITVADVDVHDGLWLVKWRTGLTWRVGPLRRGEWTQDRLFSLTECGMPLDDEGQPTVIKEGRG